MRTRRTLGLLTALLVTGCGTTVPSSQLGAGGAAAGTGLVTGDGMGVPGTAGGAPAGGDGLGPAGGALVLDGPGSVAGALGPSSTGTGPGGASSDGGVSGGQVSGGSGGPGSSGPLARGVTATTITVGVIDSESSDQVLADAGVVGGRQGSNERKASALIDAVNKAGGVAGKKLKLVVYRNNASSTTESTCTFFTQDQKVFAVLDYGQFAGEEFRACLTKGKVLLLSDHGTHFDDKDLKANPFLWPVNGFHIQRKIAAYVDGLVAQGYFSPWDTRAAAPPAAGGEVRIGLLYFDEEFNKRQNPGLRAALGRHGLKAFREFGIRQDGGSNQASDIRAAVLRFAADGVTHVLFNQEFNGGLFGLFALNASGQSYYPRYGVSSYDFPQLVKGNVPDQKAFNGMKGIGWLPYTDVDRPAEPGPAQKTCLKIFADRGQTPADLNERTIMLIDCDVFFKFAKVASFAGANLTPGAFMTGISRLGATEPCHACDRVDYSQHIDGIAAVSYLEYGADCGCVRYTKTGMRVA